MRDILGESLEQSSSFGIAALLLILWSSLSLFSNLTASLDEIFQVPERRGIWKLRIQALGMSLALVILMVASFLTSGVLRLLSVLLFDQPSFWLTIGIRFLPFGLDVVIFCLLFRFVPARFVPLGCRAAHSCVGSGGLGDCQSWLRLLPQQSYWIPDHLWRYLPPSSSFSFGQI